MIRNINETINYIMKKSLKIDTNHYGVVIRADFCSFLLTFYLVTVLTSTQQKKQLEKFLEFFLQ